MTSKPARYKSSSWISGSSVSDVVFVFDSSSVASGSSEIGSTSVWFVSSDIGSTSCVSFVSKLVVTASGEVVVFSPVVVVTLFSA